MTIRFEQSTLSPAAPEGTLAAGSGKSPGSFFRSQGPATPSALWLPLGVLAVLLYPAVYLERHALGARAAPQDIRVGSGLLRVALGTALRDTGLDARGRRTLARGRGMLAGVAGSAYVEYRRD